MSDSTVVEAPHITVYFARKINDGNFGATEVGIHFPVDVADTEPETMERLYHVLAVAKATVYGQLGIEYTMDGQIVVEKVERAFPNSTEAPAASAPRPAASAPSGSPHAVFGTCAGCGGTDFWDNRQTKKGRQPDGKCKNRTCNKGIWLDSK